MEKKKNIFYFSIFGNLSSLTLCKMERERERETKMTEEKNKFTKIWSRKVIKSKSLNHFNFTHFPQNPLPPPLSPPKSFVLFSNPLSSKQILCGFNFMMELFLSFCLLLFPFRIKKAKRNITFQRARDCWKFEFLSISQLVIEKNWLTFLLWWKEKQGEENFHHHQTLNQVKQK